MCQHFEKHLGISSSRLISDLPARNYRRQMKPVLPRKVTAAARINLNKFWNDLEEFYSRYDDRRSSNNNNPVIEVSDRLPAYTTDTFDHDREAAENELNEKMESDKFRESTYISFSSNLDPRPTSAAVDDSDSDSGAEDFDFFPPPPAKFYCSGDLGVVRPPRNLIDLIHRISAKH
jgi:hypothetical protein